MDARIGGEACSNVNGDAISSRRARDDASAGGPGGAACGPVENSPVFRRRKAGESESGVCNPPPAADAEVGGAHIETDDGSDHRRPQPTSDDGEASARDTVLTQRFWRTYDTVTILSICAVLGIMFRMMSATWFRMELGSVFSEDSALGTNLPLNMWSCFLMGLLCSGREAMGIVHSKVLGGGSQGSGRSILDVGKGAYRGVVNVGRAGMNRVRGYGNVGGTNRGRLGNDGMNSSESGLENDTVEISPSTRSFPEGERCGNDQPKESNESIAGLMGLDDEFRVVGSHRSSEDEIREVQLQALSRRIMASPSLVIFCARKEDTDVMEHYENDSIHHLALPEDQFEIGDLEGDVNIEMGEQSSSSGEASGEAPSPPQRVLSLANKPKSSSSTSTENGNHNGSMRRNSSIDYKVNEIVHGWNKHSSPEEMKHIILLGLRVGFCGALSTFSSLNASVIRLLKAGSIGEALVGYALSIQIGIVSYRFGQHLAVYIFVWRCRREAKRDEKRGYGLRLRGLESDKDIDEGAERAKRRRVVPVRTIATLLFAGMLIALCLAVYFSTNQSRTKYWCSLLFTPFGCLARFALMNRYNQRLSGFPLGTFSCNLLSCALSGSLGSFLAGNPGPEESILLTSIIAGFAGSLSTFAAFIVEILSLMDPIIFKADGVIYALVTIVWAVIIGYLGSQAKNWADEI